VFFLEKVSDNDIEWQVGDRDVQEGE